jgi:hypothetical protein
MARLDASDAAAVARTSTPLVSYRACPASVTVTGNMGATVAGEGRADTRGESCAADTEVWAADTELQGLVGESLRGTSPGGRAEGIVPSQSQGSCYCHCLPIGHTVARVHTAEHTTQAREEQIQAQGSQSWEIGASSTAWLLESRLCVCRLRVCVCRLRVCVRERLLERRLLVRHCCTALASEVQPSAVAECAATQPAQLAPHSSQPGLHWARLHRGSVPSATQPAQRPVQSRSAGFLLQRKRRRERKRVRKRERGREWGREGSGGGSVYLSPPPSPQRSSPS